MWVRSELKEKARTAFRANYWMSVLAAFILTLVAGSGGSSAGKASSTSNSLASSAGNYDGFASLFAVTAILVIIALVIVFAIIKIIIGNALYVGSEKLLINNEVSPEDVKAKDIGFVFNEGHWKNVAITMFLKDLFTSLWTLLFIIPGIVKSYEYKMIPFLLAENPEMDRNEAFAVSKSMMNGQKWNAFVLDLSFIGWFILSGLTFGILGIFYVMPYYHQTTAELYLTLKSN